MQSGGTIRCVNGLEPTPLDMLKRTYLTLPQELHSSVSSTSSASGCPGFPVPKVATALPLAVAAFSAVNVTYTKTYPNLDNDFN